MLSPYKISDICMAQLKWINFNIYIESTKYLPTQMPVYTVLEFTNYNDLVTETYDKN